MMNFSFLSQRTEYALFAPACVEAEKIYVSAPASAAGYFRSDRLPPCDTPLSCKLSASITPYKNSAGIFSFLALLADFSVYRLFPRIFRQTGRYRQ